MKRLVRLRRGEEGMTLVMCLVVISVIGVIASASLVL